MSTGLDGFEHAYAHVNGVRLHYVTGGSGDPLVLLPGWPRTWWQYRKMMPALAEHFRVIVCEYRGMGDSEKPESGYDKATMAQDIYALVRHLGYDRVNIAGEDVGSWIAYFFAATHPQSTAKLAMWDPGAPDPALAALPALPASAEANAWHFGFNQLDGLPERLLAGRYRILIDWYAEKIAGDPEAIDAESRAVYARAYDSPEAIRAVAGWYRTLSQDIQEATRFPELTMPVLVPGGEFLDISRASNEHRARDIRFVRFPGAGHYVAEERPEELSRELIGFFGGASVTAHSS
ncbi:alpha/beta fold hydrolase [Streptomyces sp. MMS24-I2-30]|uniref:alpha/beta fold hydrolase n=1 Tax=Streptomyces sp. MMS24-I2-30 TaxID=3351564 RepID=UPI0038969A41